MGQRFKRAIEIPIYDEDCNPWFGVKGLVNEADKLDRFSIVGEGYKVAQHDEVYDVITKALEDLNIEHKVETIEMKSSTKLKLGTVTTSGIQIGARIRINIKLPQTYASIAGETINLWASCDNSYNTSTGLRLEVNAYMPKTDTDVYCSEVISESLNRFYHRHTKNLEVAHLEGTLSESITIFQERVVKEFQQLADTPMTGLEAKNFINEMIEVKKAKKEGDKAKKGATSIAMKYLESIAKSLTDVEDRIYSAWNLYSLISSILTTEVASIDLRRDNARELLSRIKKLKGL